MVLTGINRNDVAQTWWYISLSSAVVTPSHYGTIIFEGQHMSVASDNFNDIG